MISKTIVEAMRVRIEPRPQAFRVANLDDPLAPDRDRARHRKGRVHRMNRSGRVDGNFLHHGFRFALMMKSNGFNDERYKRDILMAIGFPVRRSLFGHAVAETHGAANCQPAAIDLRWVSHPPHGEQRPK
ncbi:MAG: hypothetical protein QF666_16670 [Alphaproteobacteria bacterium]|nr:hypothetical protein [Alphaproteobacteria bacterium]